MFYFTDISKTERKFDNKKFKSYKRIWDCNHQGIQDTVQNILRSRSSVKINIEKTWPLLDKENISNTNNVLHKICNTENWSSVVDEEDDISYLNEKHVVDDKTLCNISVTPQRYALRPTRTLFSDNNLEHFSNVVEEDENEIDLVINDDYVPDSNCDSSDGSIKCNQQNLKLSVQKKFSIL